MGLSETVLSFPLGSCPSATAHSSPLDIARVLRSASEARDRRTRRMRGPRLSGTRDSQAIISVRPEERGSPVRSPPPRSPLPQPPPTPAALVASQGPGVPPKAPDSVAYHRGAAPAPRCPAIPPSQATLGFTF
ncbi:hypothetical protein SKAU_G00368090 [Synaphobranchus kaupii]|uniref:Uncharacterized protein n=1 Tax=Synaphobranchus kaupii TaxID=118154 RepID=A0A9Q1IDJ6_SYNKA|nr:hypothetical protein SKAU_G00368090 [Synaphobranchus kaupii]